jgi:hypothetical protein
MRKDGLTDGEKDMAKLKVAFRVFSNAHKETPMFQTSWKLSAERNTSGPLALL